MLPDAFITGVTARVGHVGLNRAISQEPGLPSGTVSWVGTYAILLACPTGGNLDELEATNRQATGWLAAALEAWRSGPGRLMDAYLMLVLSDAPKSAPVLDWARRAELETTVCRRHVLWTDDGTWDRGIDEVTVLPLPTPGTVAPAGRDPELPKRANRVLELLAQKATIAAVVQQIRAEADSAAGVPHAN